MPPPVRQPKFFLDRSLGRVAVPSILRDAGWDVVTLSEFYGIPGDEQVADTQWIGDAARNGWPVLMKDKRIRYRQAELDAVVRNKAQCFVITRGDLTSAEAADRFLHNERAILVAVAGHGPFIYAVQSDRLDSLYPRPPTQDRSDSKTRS